MYKIKSNIFFFVTEYPVAHPSIITLWKQNGSGANCRTESMNLCFMISRHHDRSSMKIWIIYKHTKAFFIWVRSQAASADTLIMITLSYRKAAG